MTPAEKLHKTVLTPEAYQGEHWQQKGDVKHVEVELKKGIWFC